MEKSKSGSKILVFIIGFMAIFSLLMFKGGNIAHASSTKLSEAKAKTEHLSWSLHNNYLGIKNQGQWQSYIKEIRELIRLSQDEGNEAKDLLVFLDKADALVQGLSRINQVEKSIETNFLGIKNARQWNYYIILAENDLLKVDKEEFLKEYNELVGRMEKCQRTIENIEADFETEYDEALKVYFKAEYSRKASDAYAAYEAAKKLGTCEESDYLENECKMLLVRIGEIKLSEDEQKLQEAYEKLDNYLQETGLSITTSGAESVKAEIQKIIDPSIGVQVNVEFIHPSNGEETYNVILSKGSYKMHPIVLVFSIR